MVHVLPVAVHIYKFMFRSSFLDVYVLKFIFRSLCFHVYIAEYRSLCSEVCVSKLMLNLEFCVVRVMFRSLSSEVYVENVLF